MEMKDAISRFLSYPVYKEYFKYTSFAKTTVSRILNILQEKYRSSELAEKELSYAIEETVKSYISNKNSAINILKIFVDFLKKEYAINTQINFPKVDISNSFERQMYLAKVLQSADKTVDDLADELWVSKRTIEKDLSRIRGMTDDPIQICGKPFIVRETERRRGSLFFTSTVHPFFLTFNLTQVISTLKGLKLMCNEPALKRYALLSAGAIWQQLSNYAKERIFYVTTNLMPDEVDWYKSLEKSDEEMFYTEYECSNTTSGTGVLIDCLKNEKTFFLEYLLEEGKTIFLSNCKIVFGSYTRDNMKVLSDEGEYTIVLDRVLRSAYNKEELF